VKVLSSPLIQVEEALWHAAAGLPAAARAPGALGRAVVQRSLR